MHQLSRTQDGSRGPDGVGGGQAAVGAVPLKGVDLVRVLDALDVGAGDGDVGAKVFDDGRHRGRGGM